MRFIYLLLASEAMLESAVSDVDGCMRFYDQPPFSQFVSAWLVEL